MMRLQRYFVVDIETAPLPDAAEYLEPVQAPSNYGEAASKAYIERETPKQLGKAALDLDLCEVVAIGWKVNDETECVVWAGDEYTEAAMLSAFWRSMPPDAVFVGHNILGFDLPVMLRRSLYLGMNAPNVNLDRYRTPHIDLQQRLCFNGLLKPRSKDFYCRRFGISVDDPFTGADVPQLVAEGRWADVANHCRADVEKEYQLAVRIGVLKPAAVPV